MCLLLALPATVELKWMTHLEFVQWHQLDKYFKKFKKTADSIYIHTYNSSVYNPDKFGITVHACQGI